jgi:hypothetical protein
VGFRKRDKHKTMGTIKRNCWATISLLADILHRKVTDNGTVNTSNGWTIARNSFSNFVSTAVCLSERTPRRRIDLGKFTVAQRLTKFPVFYENCNPLLCSFGILYEVTVRLRVKLNTLYGFKLCLRILHNHFKQP